MNFSTSECAHSDHGNIKSWNARVSSKTAARWLRALTPVFLSVVLFGLAGPAQAATITVDTTSELVAADGFCSLREAITAANTDAAVDTCAAGSGADIIVLPAGTYTLTTVDNGVNGLPVISTDITIQGAGAATTIIRRDPAAPAFRFLEVYGSLTLDSVTINGGAAPATWTGGAVYVASGGSATIRACVFSGNNAQGGNGGAIDVTWGGLLTIQDSTFTGNSASNAGGAIITTGTTVSITSSTFVGNTSGRLGGGIINWSGTMTIVNSTFSANVAVADDGGAIYTLGTTILNNVTVTGNSANSGGGGLLLSSGATLITSNTILAGNTTATSGPDCLTATGTSITSQGNNLIGNSSGCIIASGVGDQIGTGANPINPLLAPLASNGGPTQTHALLTGSPAVDAGNSAAPGGPLPACAATDQRGVARPVGAACDIGAYEGSVIPVADLGIAKTDSPDPVNVSSNLTYTLTVTNNGPNLAPGVTVTDTLPAGVTFVSATASVGTCSQAAGVVTCNLGVINNGASVTITIVVRPTAAGTLNNTASVTSSATDGNAANDSATASTTVNALADLGVTKTDAPDPVVQNSNITYTITVANAGPGAATSTVLTDTLAASVTFVSATASQGACAQAGVTVTCALGTINSGANATATIVVRANTLGTVNNTASATSSLTDPNAANNTATASTTVNPPVATDFSLTLVPVTQDVRPSGLANYTATLAPLPAGSTFNTAIALTCFTTPIIGTCAASPASVTPGLNPAASTIIVTIPQSSLAPGAPSWPPLLYPLTLLGFSLAMAALMMLRRRARNPRFALLVLALVLVLTQAACQAAVPFVGPYTVTVTATSGSLSHSATAMVNVVR